MNIINKGFLKIALAPARFYGTIGVDVSQLRAILTTKLTMDDRRVSAMAQARRRNKDKKVSAATIGTMIFSALLGVVFLLVLSIGSHVITRMTLYFTMFFFMLSLMLISDFTSVLIDVRDNFIILPKPVSDRTFVVARLLHIFIHICKIVLPMGLPGIIMISLEYGVGGGVLFLLCILMVTAFAIFCINAVYIIILKVTTPQKFQNIISYIQIVFAIVVYAAYQVVPRMFSKMHLEDLDLESIKGIFAYPIFWFANTWKVLYSFGGTQQQLIAAVLGLLAPVVSVIIVVKYLAPSFNNKLALINSSGAPQTRRPANARTGRSYSGFLARAFTGSPAEKMGFLFTWKMSSRSRDFKLKVYPAIGYLVVYVVVMFMNSKNFSLSDLAGETTKAKVVVISAVYFTSFLLVMAINQVIYSEKYKASWIYYVTPIAKPGEVVCGSAKASILKFYIPMVFFITVAGLWLVGIKILPNIILGLFNEVLIATVLVFVGNKMFPFSVHQSTNVKAGSFLKSLLILAISGIIAFGHFLIYSVLPAVILCTVLSGIASWFMMDSIKNVSWEAIKSSYSE